MLYGQPPSFIWVKQMGGMQQKVANSIVADASGNVYTAGAFSGTVDFDPGPAVFNLSSPVAENIFVSKLNAAGNFVWAKQMTGDANGNATSIAVDASGNVYTTGHFYGTTDFDPGPLIFSLTSIGSADIFISKLDAAGNFVWAKQMGGAAYKNANSIAINVSGYIYTTGSFSSTVDFDPGPGVVNLVPSGTEDIFISKLDLSGNFVWAKQMGGGVDAHIFGISITSDASGNVYTTGSFYATTGIDFDPGPGIFILNSSFNVEKIFVSKLNASGSFVWAKQMVALVDNCAGGSGRSIALDPSGNVYSTGAFCGTVDFDPGPGTSYLITSSPEGEGFISKLDGSGNFAWAKKIGEFSPPASYVTGYSITADASGDIYTTGYFRGIVDFDPGAAVFNMSALGSGDAFVSKLNASGDFVWAKQMGGSGGSCGGYSVAVDALGNVYTTGVFSGTVDFDPGGGIYNLTSVAGNFQSDIFVHKMGRCANSTSSILTVTDCKSYTLNGITYTSSGVYTQIIVNTAGCDSIITLNLTINRINTAVNVSSCNNYTWNGSTYFTSGTYIDTLIANNGCDSIITLQLTILTKPSPYLGTDTSICNGRSIKLYPGLFNTYTWQDGSLQNNFIVTQPGLYSVVVTNNCGSASDEIIITEGICDFYFPSAFTPNNDSKNDEFKILGAQNIKDYHLLIYNRYGQKIFETTDPAVGWTGKYKGKLQETGVYVWQCSFTRSGFANNMNGTVILLK